MEITILENKVKPYYDKNHSSHSWNHIERVLRTAQKIADTEENVARDILTAMIFFHDIIRHEDEKEKDSVEDSLILAQQIMSELEFSKDFIEKVNHGIRSHSLHSKKREKPNSIEAKILFDADKIEGTGSIGVARWLMVSSNKKMSLKNSAKLYLETVKRETQHESFFLLKKAKKLVKKD